MSVGFFFGPLVSDGIYGFFLHFVWLPGKEMTIMRNYGTIPLVWEREMGGGFKI